MLADCLTESEPAQPLAGAERDQRWQVRVNGSSSETDGVVLTTR